MIKLLLTNNMFAFIDKEDFEKIALYKWTFTKANKHYGRVKSNTGLFLHRLIMNAPQNLEVDHINGDTLDNRKSNLRLVSRKHNQKNMTLSRRSKSGYKGVSWHKKAKKWQAHLMSDGIRIYLGLYLFKEDAAKAYNIASLAHHGEFGKLNKINS